MENIILRINELLENYTIGAILLLVACIVLELAIIFIGKKTFAKKVVSIIILPLFIGFLIYRFESSFIIDSFNILEISLNDLFK